MANSSVLDYLIKIHDDPDLFVREFLGVTPEPWQSEMLRNVAEFPRVRVRSAHGVGKRATLTWIILWYLLTRYPCKIGITAPSAPQLEAALLPELAHWWSKLPMQFRSKIELRSDRAFLTEAPSEAFAVARTASRDRPEALQGLHSANMLFIIDEARGVDEKVFQAAMSSLTSPNAKVVMCRNPLRLRGYFYDRHNRTSSLWKTMVVSAFDSKFSREGSLIKMVKESRGEGRDDWAMRVLGNFPSQDESQVINRGLVESARDRNVQGNPNAPIVFGVDIARQGNDRTTLAIRQGNLLLEPVKAIQSKDLMQTRYWLKDIYDRTLPQYRPDEIFIDLIGVGAGVFDRCRELDLPVIGVNVAESPALKDRFSRLRDELWWRGREWFENRDCRIPRRDREELIVELCSPTFTYDNLGKIKVESKESMKKRGFKSPDLADAFLLTLFSVRTGSRNRIERPVEYDTDWVV